VLAAFAHGTLFGVGAVVAAGMVPADRQARAIGLMFLGLTLANVLGVPLGTFVGQNFGWRATFGLITLLGLVALVPLYLLVPDIATRASGGMRRELSVLRRFDVLLAIATTALASASIFTLFTYIVPLLQDLTGFAPETSRSSC
jgi:DHA1 family inner membrane transport protein